MGSMPFVTIALRAKEFLKPGSWLLFEHGWDQAELIQHILRDRGWREIICHSDFDGRHRVTKSFSP